MEGEKHLLEIHGRLGQFLCSRIGGSKGVISDQRPNRAFLRSRKSVFSIPIFSMEQSDPRIPSKISDARIGLLDRKNKLKDHRISHHPRKHTITPYNSPDAGLTAAAAAAASHSDSAWHILFSARQQRVLSSDGSSACHR